MVRRMAVVVLALTLNPALVRAQSPVLTVTAPSASSTRVRAPPLPSSAMSRAAPCCPSRATWEAGPGLTGPACPRESATCT